MVHSRVIVVAKEVDDSSLTVNEIRKIASNGPAIGMQTGYTLDEMHSKEMQSILDVLNQYTETWVYPDEDD